MMTTSAQRRMLQVAVGVLSLIPIGVGLAGAAFGIRVFDHASLLGTDADNLSRYLSGLLLGIGLAFLSTLPRIESEGVRFRLLATIVFIGGIARLAPGWVADQGDHGRAGDRAAGDAGFGAVA